MKLPTVSSEIVNSQKNSELEIKNLVAPMLLETLPEAVFMRLERYVALLYRWNARMNLTAVRDPEVLVRLHIGECLRCAQRIAPAVETVLDFGSGAGFPGVFLQIVRPSLKITLAEAQAKKAGFLREVIRELDLQGTTVFAGRVQDLGASTTFDVVAMRAVDKMARALADAAPRVKQDGSCMILTSKPEIKAIRSALPGWTWTEEAVPGTEQRALVTGTRGDGTERRDNTGTRENVPRGTF